MKVKSWRMFGYINRLRLLLPAVFICACAILTNIFLVSCVVLSKLKNMRIFGDISHRAIAATYALLANSNYICALLLMTYLCLVLLKKFHIFFFKKQSMERFWINFLLQRREDKEISVTIKLFELLFNASTENVSSSLSVIMWSLFKL